MIQQWLGFIRMSLGTLPGQSTRPVGLIYGDPEDAPMFSAPNWPIPLSTPKRREPSRPSQGIDTLICPPQEKSQETEDDEDEGLFVDQEEILPDPVIHAPTPERKATRSRTRQQKSPSGQTSRVLVVAQPSRSLHHTTAGPGPPRTPSPTGTRADWNRPPQYDHDASPVLGLSPEYAPWFQGWVSLNEDIHQWETFRDAAPAQGNQGPRPSKQLTRAQRALRREVKKD